MSIINIVFSGQACDFCEVISVHYISNITLLLQGNFNTRKNFENVEEKIINTTISLYAALHMILEQHCSVSEVSSDTTDNQKLLQQQAQLARRITTSSLYSMNNYR